MKISIQDKVAIPAQKVGLAASHDTPATILLYSFAQSSHISLSIPR
jgi:hypothetical protein